MRQADWFMKKRLRTLSYALLLGFAAFGAAILTEYDPVKGMASIPEAIRWGASNFYPTGASLEKLPVIWRQLRETLLLSVAATTTGACLAFGFAVAGSRVMKRSGFISRTSRGIATLFRNIDVAAWAMILLFSFGQNVMAGYCALLFGSFGFLTRAFMETIDEAGGESVEALEAAGAGFLPIVFHSVLPTSLPQMVSWLLFVLETNIRQATLVGLLTGTGIGFTFNLYYKSLNYHAASLVVLVLVAAILTIELLSNTIRRVIL